MLKINKSFLIASISVFFFSISASASGGSVYCLGSEIVPTEQSEALLGAIEACTYRVARAKAALRGEKGVQAYNYSYIDSFSEVVDAKTETFRRTANVTIKSNIGVYVEVIELEGTKVTENPESDDVDFYVENVEGALGIKINQ